MKAVHEFGHATACHRFGGHVRETGVAFICFFPVAYVDVSSSWRFSNKWHRITVAAAGIYIELLIAGVCSNYLVLDFRLDCPRLALQHYRCRFCDGPFYSTPTH